jgi:hypothetical protein
LQLKINNNYNKIIIKKLIDCKNGVESFIFVCILCGGLVLIDGSIHTTTYYTELYQQKTQIGM